MYVCMRWDTLSGGGGHTETRLSVDILEVTRKRAAHGDAACWPPVLWQCVDAAHIVCGAGSM